MTTQLSPTLEVKRNDTRPHLDVVIEDGTGHALNLTGATVAFSMRNAADQIAKVTDVACNYP